MTKKAAGPHPMQHKPSEHDQDLSRWASESPMHQEFRMVVCAVGGDSVYTEIHSVEPATGQWRLCCWATEPIGSKLLSQTIAHRLVSQHVMAALNEVLLENEPF